MLVGNTPSLLLHRLAITEGETLPAALALVAKYRGEILNQQSGEAEPLKQDQAAPANSDGVFDKKA